MNNKFLTVRRRLLTGVAAVAIGGSLPAFIQPASAQAPEIEEIVVTGTLIRGIAPTGTNVIALTPESVSATGVVRTNDLMNELPQMGMFMGQYDIGLSSNTQVQARRPNLRNLPGANTAGGGSTLVLIDGHRVAGAGIKQTSVDPDVIPPGVMERVEIIPDGGSSIYGADAVGGVVNFITRRKFDGAKVEGRYGFADAYYQFDVNAVVGRTWGNTSGYIAYSFAKNDAIFGRDREFVRRRSTTNTFNPDVTCNPGNVLIRVGLVQTNYALPALVPNTTNGCDTTDDQAYYPEEERQSAYAGFAADVSDSMQLDIRGYYTRRGTLYTNTARSSGTIATNNPFYRRTPDNPAPQTPLAQTISFSWESVLGRNTEESRTMLESWGVTPTLSIDVGTWQLRTMANFGGGTTKIDNDGANGTLLSAALRETGVLSAFNPYDLTQTNPAVIANIRNFHSYGLAKNKLMNYRAIVDGPLFSLPGGEVRTALGVEYVEERNKARIGSSVRGLERNIPQAIGRRHNTSFFGELNIPLVGAANGRPGIESLSVSASGRHDKYSDFGSTFNPKIGFTYEPLNWISVRGSWGKSFNAPSLADSSGAPDNSLLITTASVYSSPLPGQFVPAQAQWPVFATQGGNPNIRPQKARTLSIGTDVSPPFLEGSKFSLTYYNITMKDLIGTPPNNQIINFFTNYRQYYVLNPTRAQVEAIVSSVSDGLTRVAPYFADGALPIYLVVDARRGNLGELKLDGLDFAFSYTRPTSFGSIDANITGNYDLNRETSAVAGAVFTNVLAVDFQRFRMATTVGANVNNLRAQLTWQHSAGFNITPAPTNNGQTHVGDFNVFNLFLRYDLKDQGGFLRDTSLSLSVNNLFDQDPPLYTGTFNFSFHGYANGKTLGRLIQFGVSKKF